MILDQPEERGLAFIDERWGDPTECRFPLFNFLKPLPLVGMYLVHLVMLIGKECANFFLYFKLVVKAPLLISHRVEILGLQQFTL